MTTKQLADCVAVKVGLTKKAADETVNAVFAIISESLQAKEEVKIQNFGNFVVKTNAARKTRNPQTGETILTPAKDVVKFKASKVILQCDGCKK